MHKVYSIREVMVYTKKMYLVEARLGTTIVSENIFSHAIDAEAWVEHMKELDLQQR